MPETASDARLCDVKWGTFVLLGILSVIFGIVIMFYPALTAEVLVTLFGILMLILAFLAIILALMTPGTEGLHATWLLIAGIIGFLIGIGAIISPIIWGAIITWIIAIVLFVIGVVNIILALSETTFQHRWLILLAGIIGIIFAILLMIYPVIGSIVLFGYLIAIFFFVYGILSIIAGFALKGTKEICIT